MLQTLKNAWKIPELRRKIFYTVMLIIVFRLGTFIPVPYLSQETMQQLLDTSGANSLLDFLNTFSGGAFAQATIFAMSVTPYINASIIMQLMTVVIPALERIQKEGEQGRQRMNQYTRYLATTLGFLQATGLYFLVSNEASRGVLSFFVMTMTFTAGTAFLMWLGEQISEKGIGSGISVIIFAGIVSRAPAMIDGLSKYMEADGSWFVLAAIVIGALLIVAAVVLMNDSERRLQVQYAKRVVGRKMYGGQSSHIPIKLLAAGVMPIIFAMSILTFPSTIAQFFNVNESSAGWVGTLLKYISPSGWIYGVLCFLLIVFFTFFYTTIQFNPVEIANGMKRNGGFFPGIRAGKPTSDYIARVLSRLTIAGATFLGLMAVLPIFLSMMGTLNINIGGTSILIVVGVAMETTRQLESLMLMRSYKGFME
ncbi:MAG: preprotein translocase subunit SecY [Clostridiales bacterium]|jgi:preprotein translocase subunit SecY|nr:preprotein translocase subunit SecY [Clostridiales bacterium]